MTIRKFCLDTLVQVYQEHGYISLLLRVQKEYSAQDMAFASELLYGSVRNHSWLTYQWQSYAKQKPDLRTACLLDMSVYQLFRMDSVPDYAVINEAVELADRSKKGFVNAVLHKVQKRGPLEPEEYAVRCSHPQWLLNLWKAQYGEARMQSIVEMDQAKPTVFGRINTLKTSKEELQKKYPFVTDIGFVFPGNPAGSEEFRAGKILVQNLSSQEVVKALDPQPGERILDACAAPGTKTQQIAMAMADKGEIVAMDLYEHRCDLIRRCMRITGTNIVHVLKADSTRNNGFPEESFDRVLLDVPCSGLGDLRHKPEIRWHLCPKNLDEIQQTQADILRANAGYVKKGGILVYSTCTLNKKENEKQIAGFLQERTDFVLLSEKTIWPDPEGRDGFYIAKLKKEVC